MQPNVTIPDILTQQQKMVVESKLQDELAARFEQELKINVSLFSILCFVQLYNYNLDLI